MNSYLKTFLLTALVLAVTFFGVMWVWGQSHSIFRNPAALSAFVKPTEAICTSSNALVSPNPASNPGAGGEYVTNKAMSVTLTHDGTAFWATNGDASPTWNTYTAAVDIPTNATAGGTNKVLFRYMGSNATCTASAVASNLYTLTNAPVPWTPNSLTDIQLWFRPEDLSGSAGDSISNWKNAATGKSDYYATNNTAVNKPHLTNNFGGLSGTNCLFFDDEDQPNEDFLAVQYLGLMRNKASCSIVAVCYPRAPLSVNNTRRVIVQISKNTPAYESRDCLVVGQSEYVEMQQRTLDADSVFTASTTGGAGWQLPTNQIHVLHADFTHASAAAVSLYVTNLATYINNLASSATTNNTSDTDSALVGLGGWGEVSGISGGFAGEIAEVVVTVPKMSAADRTNTWNYLKTKYGL